MRRLIGFFAAMLCLALPAAAREGRAVAIALDVNSGAVVEIGDDGTSVAGLRGVKLDPPTLWVRTVARHLTGGQYDWAVGDKAALFEKGAVGVEEDPVPSGEIHIAFRAIGDSDQRLLVIANGYDRALVYRAQIRRDGRTAFTDVCTVLPGMHAFEHWPFAIDRITLGELRLEDWPRDAPPRCE